MRRVLLVAEGSLDHPLRNVASIFAGMTATLACGFLIVRSGIPLPLTVVALAALLLGMAWLQTRFGGQRQFRLEKRGDSEPLRITGDFEDGRVGSGASRELAAAELAGDALRLTVADKQGTEHFHLRPPAFSPESLELLLGTIQELQTLSLDRIRSRYSQSDGKVRFYDAKKLILLRFHQKPGYMMVLWLVSGITVLFWFVAGRSLLA